ncbi:MAG: helix-turn-helix transcriptional regulator, partial [Spirulinaceae cyanobacterium RM2_2_10]|nr:helix-turn-helix transcriptional regulator [Spirulinaceae cyanobacterium RM2_2_10]
MFADPGYDATTARMLAQEAGISVGGVFANFASMEDILAEIVMEGYDHLAHLLVERRAGETGAPADRLKESFRIAFEAYAPRHAMLMH